jgi:hypothetical protein
MLFHSIFCPLFLFLLPQLSLTLPGGTAKVNRLVLNQISDEDANSRPENQRRGSDGSAKSDSVTLTPMSDESSLWGREGHKARKRGNGGLDLSRLDLKKQEHFLYGSPIGGFVRNQLNPQSDKTTC